MLSSLTQEQVTEARSLRNRGYSYRQIARGMKFHPETVQRALDPKYRKMRAEQIARAKLRHVDEVKTALRAPEPRRYVPPHVMADRDRRAEIPRSITSLVLGDPPPGYSALDRR